MSEEITEKQIEEFVQKRRQEFIEAYKKLCEEMGSQIVGVPYIDGDGRVRVNLEVQPL